MPDNHSVATARRKGLLRKLSGTATEYLDGSGAWSTPEGTGGGGFSTTITSVNTTSGTSVELKSGIPAGTERIDFVFDGVSLDASHQLTLQFGTSGGYGSIMAGSQSYNTSASGTQTNTTNSLTSNIILFAASGGATDTVTGRVECYLIDSATNLWSVWWSLGSIGAQKNNWGTALFTMTGTLTKVQSTTTAGTANFDAGKVWTVLYDFEGSSGAAGSSQWICIVVSDETTAITTGTAKRTFRLPACTVHNVRASLTTASSSGTPTFDINEGGTSILGTKLIIDASEKTTTTYSGSAATITDSAIADDAEMTIDIDTSGTGATGAKIYMEVTWT